MVCCFLPGSRADQGGASPKLAGTMGKEQNKEKVEEVLEEEEYVAGSSGLSSGKGQRGSQMRTTRGARREPGLCPKHG